MADVSEVVASLRREWSLDFTRVRRVLAELSQRATVSDLVAASGLPRRDVESVLATLRPLLKTEDDRYRLAEPAAAEPLMFDQAQLVGRMAELASGLPPSRWRLDHVSATPETMARRARYLAERYELDGASVLCLGDHDLTSLAVSSVASADVTVVDIDEPILDHIARSAGRLDHEVGPAGGPGLPVTTAWADLRLALPPSLTGTADLVFTDPPYTVEGMRLFLVRALEALRPTGHERLAFCFGTGERHLVKALEVQALLGELRLALEAMLPGFNHYAGAEAIGARSDLYICRPTKGAKVGEAPRPATSRRSGRSKARRPATTPAANIYTRGPSAEEAAAYAIPEPIATAAIAAAGGNGPVLLIGEGWPSAPAHVSASQADVSAGPPSSVTLPDFFARVAAWATAARPGPFPYAGTPVVNTSPDFGPAALRTLLLIAPERAVFVVPRRDLPPAELLRAAYDLEVVPAGPGGDPAVLLVTRQGDPPGENSEAVLRYILLHPGAKVVNAWRDALIAVSRERGEAVTKNEARARIGIDRLDPTLRGLRVWELPLSALRRLAAEITRSVENS